MPDLLTSRKVSVLDECADRMPGIPAGEVRPVTDTIVAACQALADSPCPVCFMPGGILDPGMVMCDDHENGPHPVVCWRCGAFSADRRGKAFERWQDACDSLG